MARALAVIELERDGETWVNTHGLINGTIHLNPPNATDFDVWGANGDLSDDATNPSTTPVLPTMSILQALIRYTRVMTWEGVTLTRLYISDGKKNTVSGGSTFFTADLGYQGFAFPDLTAESIVPGFVTLQVNRRPFGFSNRRGRQYLRGALLDTEVLFKGRGLVDFTNLTQRGNVESRLNTALNTSNLRTYMRLPGALGEANAVAYGLPSYYRDSDPQSGQLEDMAPIASLVVRGVVNRQVKRGRREKKANTP